MFVSYSDVVIIGKKTNLCAGGITLKEKLLSSYEKMTQKMIEQGWDIELAMLAEDTTYQYGGHTFKLVKGVTVPKNCPNDEFAKILFMRGKVNEAWLRGILTLEEIGAVIEKVYAECA